MSRGPYLSWPGILRLGLVQTSLGAIVVLTTSTMNRILVVEQALPALLPGFLVALHYVVQLSRPRFGHASDQSGRRTPWIIGGMAVLALGGFLAAVATAWIGDYLVPGLIGAVIAFTLIGVGVGISGTSLLALLASRVDPRHRAAAGSTVWIMMICGFVVTATLVGHFLDPYSPARLITITAIVAAIALTLTILAVTGIERSDENHAARPAEGPQPPPAVPFRIALRNTWMDARARTFTVFVFVSMLAYSTQDLILEPFAGIVFAMTPGESTQLSGVQSGGVLVGMLLVALSGSLLPGRRTMALRVWTVGGCIGSGAALLGLSAAGIAGPPWPLQAGVFALGLANGAFAAAAIGMMMALASANGGREGVRMGLWGAAQAMAFALGGLLGTAAIDLMRWLALEPALAYALVFAMEAVIFLAAARIALGITVGEQTADADSDSLPGNQPWRLTT